MLQERLLLCLHGLGTNTGLKRMAAGQAAITYKDLLYVCRRFIIREHLREAVARVVNATLRVRRPLIWGHGTTACAADAKQFGAWDQNLMAEWHTRYGGRGVIRSLARRAQEHLHLLAAEDLLLLGGGGHDRGRAPPLH